MTRREELQDRYEDALFALLMNEIADTEGAMALEENERLKNDPTAAVPEDMDKRCLQTIRRHFAKQRVHTAGRFTVKAVKYIVLAAGLAALMFTGAFAASETVRVNTMNLLIEVFGDSTDFRVAEENLTNVSPQLSVGWLPDGYELSNQGNEGWGTWYQYQKSDNEFIWIECALASNSEAVFSLDTEDAETEYVEINGIEAMLVQKDAVKHLAWMFEDNSMFIQVIGEGINREEVLHVANELKY